MKATDIIKPAILRLLYDMINADGVIHDYEIGKLEDLKHKYKIYPKDSDGSITRDAHKITFSYALEILKEWKHSDQYLYDKKLFSVENIQRDLLELAIIDKDISSSETLILIAYDYVVITERAKCFSCKERELRFSKKEVLYIENKYDEHLNKEINENYTLISDKLKLHGFEFVYVPKVRDFFIEKDRQDLLKYAIRFMHPINVKYIDETKVLSDELKKVTTDKFIKYYFSKNNIQNSIAPSILIKLKKTRIAIQDSKTKYESYYDFLMIPIGHSVFSSIKDLTDNYLRLLGLYNCDISISSSEMINGHSFHKTLLNYLVYKSFSGEVSELILCYGEERKEYIEFKGIKQTCHLSTSEIAIYLIVLVMTYKCGGLYRKKCKLSESMLKKIQGWYNDLICSSDKDIYTSIDTVVPKINDKIKEVQRLEDSKSYQILKQRKSKSVVSDELKYSLSVNFNMVKIRYYSDDKMVSLDEWITEKWDKSFQ